MCLWTVSATARGNGHHGDMTLVLDPRLPLVWRTPDSLQLGVDHPPVVLTSVTTAHERMLAALAIGLTPQGLALIGTEAGLNPAQIADFERVIRPALATPKVVASARVEIDGFGATADRLEWRVREAGMEPHRARPQADRNRAAASAGTPDIAVIVGDFVFDPERRGRWLRRDIPHLPLVFGDTSVTIGPFIEPGVGPCLYCLDLHRRDADPAWPALASQLLGKVSCAQSPFVASEAATLATRMLLRRVRDGRTYSSTSLTLDTDTGQTRERVWQTHPECACTGLKPAVVQGLQENETEHSVPAADRATQTTKGAVACVPE